MLDQRDFVDVFSVKMDILFDIMLEDQDALTVPAHLVQSQTVGRIFNALLSQYLADKRLGALSDHNSKVRPCLML